MSNLLEEINQELSDIVGIDIETIRELKECSPETICIYGGDEDLRDENEIVSLYKDYKYLNFEGHLKTLMYTSVTRRPANILSFLKSVRGKKCLDFGSGVGTHAMELAKNGNDVSILDVEGPLFGFAKKRLKRQGLKFNSYNHDDPLPSNEFDVIICMDVLEHVYDPLRELYRIYNALKPGGILCLVVSVMVKKTSGHFQQSVDQWKESGVLFLDDKFIQLEKGIYQKKPQVMVHPCGTSVHQIPVSKGKINGANCISNATIEQGYNISGQALIDCRDHSGSIDMGRESREKSGREMATCFHPVTEIVHSYITKILKDHNICEVIDIGGVGKLNDRFEKVHNPNIKHGIDGCRLPYDSNSFQASVSIATLEHIQDQVGFLRESIRVAGEISVHWFPFGEQGEKIERFKESMGHKHPSITPTIEAIADAVSGYHYEIIPFVSCSEHLLCLACLHPKLNIPELYNFIFENINTYYGAVLKVHKIRKTDR